VATGRTHLGLRRGRPVLRARGAALLGALLLAALSACSSTDDNDEERFALFRENSQNYYDRGAYPQALHQANMALAIEPEDHTVQLIKAFCLIKLGKTTSNPLLLDESLDIFEALLDTGEGRDDFRVSMGLGSACLARSFEHQAETERLQRRLGSDFLSDTARAHYQEALGVEEAARQRRLQEGEAALRHVLDFPLQKDNAYALVDLVLTLHARGGREPEALPLANRALDLLDESTRVTQTQLQKNTKLSATAKVDLEQRVLNNRERETMLRDLVATVQYDRGDVAGFFEQMRILEERKLMGEVQYFNRAAVHERLGHDAQAIADLEQFLRLRVMRLNFDQDDMAPEVFARIEALRAREAERARAAR
jgi:tetratricopeptide (TPR) repeat protein